MSLGNGYVKGLFSGFMAGGSIVALIALLYAPKNGKELRKDIKNKTYGYYDETEKLIADAKGKAKDMMSKGKKIFTDAKSKTDSFVSIGKEVVDGKTAKIKTSFKAGVNAYKETKNQNNEHS